MTFSSWRRCARRGISDTEGLSTELARFRVILLLPCFRLEGWSSNGGSLLGAGGAGLVGLAFCGCVDGARRFSASSSSILGTGGLGTSRVGMGGMAAPDEEAEVLGGAVDEDDEEDCATLAAIGAGGGALINCIGAGPLSSSCGSGFVFSSFVADDTA